MTPEALGLTLSPAGPLLLALGVALTAWGAFGMRRAAWRPWWALLFPLGAVVPAALVGMSWPGAQVAWGVLAFVCAVQAGSLLAGRGGVRV